MYDIIIIGAGPAGMTAAIYGQRAGKSTLMIDKAGYGGNIITTPSVENYPGLKDVSGMDFAQLLFDQATSFGAEYESAEVTGITDAAGVKTVHTDAGDFDGRTVIIATGATNRKLGLDREEQLVGSGVSFCATCDGMFFRGRDVAVIGGGNTALEDAEYLAGVANKVYLVHRRDRFRGEQKTVDRLAKLENVEFVLNSTPVRFVGDTTVAGLVVKDNETGEERELAVQGVFEAVGQVPQNANFADMTELDEAGYIKATEACKTDRPGIFVAGDCRTKKVRQLDTAAADGTIAALAASDYINSLE